MFGIGTTEFLVIIVVAVLVLGPEHLPRIMRSVTKVMSDFRRISTDFQRTINLEANKEEWERQQQAAAKPKKKKKKVPPPDDAGAAGDTDDTSEKVAAQPKTAPTQAEAPAKAQPDAGQEEKA